MTTRYDINKIANEFSRLVRNAFGDSDYEAIDEDGNFNIPDDFYLSASDLMIEAMENSGYQDDGSDEYYDAYDEAYAMAHDRNFEIC